MKLPSCNPMWRVQETVTQHFKQSRIKTGGNSLTEIKRLKPVPNRYSVVSYKNTQTHSLRERERDGMLRCRRRRFDGDGGGWGPNCSLLCSQSILLSSTMSVSLSSVWFVFTFHSSVWLLRKRKKKLPCIFFPIQFQLFRFFRLCLVAKKTQEISAMHFFFLITAIFFKTLFGCQENARNKSVAFFLITDILFVFLDCVWLLRKRKK